MDCFQVPKVVNRHVLKAIYRYSELLFQDSIPLSAIKLEVSYTMRNVNPVHDLDTLIESSVKNLTLIGDHKVTAISGSDEKEYELQLKPVKSELQPRILHSLRDCETLQTVLALPMPIEDLD